MLSLLLWITVTAAHVVLSDWAWLLNRLLGTRCCCRIEESFTLNTRQWLLIVVMDSLVTSLVFWPKCLLPCCLIIVAVIQSNDADGHVLLQSQTLHKLLLVTGLLLKGHLVKTKSALFPRAESLMRVTSKRTLWPLSAWVRVEMQQCSRQTLCPVCQASLWGATFRWWYRGLISWHKEIMQTSWDQLSSTSPWLVVIASLQYFAVAYQSVVGHHFSCL